MLTGTFNQQVSVADGAVTTYIAIPDGIVDLAVAALGSAAAALKVEKTYRGGNPAALGAADWLSVDASLDSVGNTWAVVPLGADSPTYLRVTQLTATESGDVILTGKRVRG